MTAQEVLTLANRLGVALLPDEKDRLHAQPAAALTPGLREGIRANKARLVAILKLRDWHRRMGLPEEDVLFVEQALLSGKVKEIRVVSWVSPGGPA